MNVIYSPQAIRDLEEIGAYYRANASLAVAAAIAERIEQVINRLARHPHSAPRSPGSGTSELCRSCGFLTRFSIECARTQSKSCISDMRHVDRGTTTRDSEKAEIGR
jgi:plasmid stabilization system protein ParE